jgi:hypothetical protein
VNKGLFSVALIALTTCGVRVANCDSGPGDDYRKGEKLMAGTSNVEVQEIDQVNAVASQYLAAQKKWRPDQFRLEYKGLIAGGHTIIVRAVYLEDEIRPAPGAGKSVELHIDRASRQVVRELGFQ